MHSTDRQARAEQNFRNALLDLQNSMPKEASQLLAQFNFPEVSESSDYPSEQSCSAEIAAAIERLMEATIVRTQSANKNQKAKTTARKLFRASFPFTRVFLTVAKTASAVR